MTQPKALLIGVPAYEDAQIDDLPFILTDLEELAAGLVLAGYEVEVHDTALTDRDRMMRAIWEFCKSATQGQQLLIVLSGHGMHHQGMDYLLPSTAATDSPDFVEQGLAIDFKKHIGATQCGDVLIAVDACREGVHRREKSAVAYAAGWSRVEREAVGGRSIFYLYACSPGQWARYVKSESAGFSVFSRALSQAAADASCPGELDEVVEVLQQKVSDIVTRHKLPHQQVQIFGDLKRAAGFNVFHRLVPVPAEAEHPWVRLVREHEVWDFVENGALARDTAVHISSELASRYESNRQSRTAEDPWSDEDFVARVNVRLGWILTRVLRPATMEAPPLSFSPMEATLLALFPQIHETYWSSCTAQRVRDHPMRDAGDAENAEKTVQAEHTATKETGYRVGSPRLVRRAERLTDQGDVASVSAANALNWWLFRRWLIRRPDLYRPEYLQSLRESVQQVLQSCGPTSTKTKLLNDTLDPDRLLALVKAHRVDLLDAAGVWQKEGLEPVRTVAPGTPGELTVREQFIGLLLVVAHRLAIEPISLSEIVAEHVGIRDPADPAEVVETLRTATWSLRGRTAVLSAQCQHQAVDVALNEHVTNVANLLHAIEASADRGGNLAALAGLPAHASPDRVGPARMGTGKPVYDGQGFRFRLADDRIQELLMGKQLYGDPGLAIRELYQNALDACRYRSARSRYLIATGTRLPSWEGAIHFEEGADEFGNRFLDCTDNGIGMGVKELSGVFSQAGVRFPDLPEFMEERARWADEGIVIHPNSRFGIGVLSYFMLADELTVTTCRLDRQGRPMQWLEVNIAGPGTLSRIQECDPLPGLDAGTRVRLHLREDDWLTSYLDVLERTLWLTDFAVTATTGDRTVSWQPGVLSDAAPLGCIDALAPDAYRSPAEAKATETSDVWWCEGYGTILADGVWAGEQLFGAVVNLAGQETPQVTADRLRIIDPDHRYVELRLRSQIPCLVDGGVGQDSHQWLSRISENNVRLADAIADGVLQEASAHWVVAGRDRALSVIGCFPPDDDLFAFEGGSSELPASRWGKSPPGGIRRRVGAPLWATRRDGALPEAALRWRLLAWAKAGFLPGLACTSAAPVAVARPSDLLLFSREIDGRAPWLEPGQTLLDRHVLEAADRLEAEPSEVADRFAVLGFVLEGDTWPVGGSLGDRRLLSVDLDGQPPWLSRAEPVPMGHVLAAAGVTGRPPGEISARFGELGFEVAHRRWPAEVSVDDLLLFSADGNGQRPWVSSDEQLAVGRILDLAALTGDQPETVASRLTELGFDVPAHEWPTSVDSADLTLVSLTQDGSVSWLETNEPVSLTYVLAAAHRTGRSPANVADRLRDLGFDVSQRRWLENLQSDDLVLMSLQPDGRGPWLPSEESPTIGHVLTAASCVARSPESVADRLRKLGFAVPENDWPEVVDVNDLVLMSVDLDGQAPWLAPQEHVLPAHVLAAAARIGETPVHVVRRLTELGFPVEDHAWPREVRNDDCGLLSRELNGLPPWLATDRSVPVLHVLLAAERTGREPAEVAARLSALGLSTPERVWPDTVDSDDVRYLSRDLNGQPPWLELDDHVPVHHVLTAAIAVRRSPAGIARRLAALGCVVPERSWPEVFDGDDLVITSLDLNSRRPWLEPYGKVPVGHVLAAALRTGRQAADVAGRLEALAFDVPRVTWPVQVDSDDILVLSRGLDGRAPWWDEPVPARHLLVGAVRAGRGPSELAGRLQELGVSVSQHPWPSRLDDEDRLLLSRDLDALEPYLDPDEPVPARHVIAASARTRRPQPEIADRLASLGLNVPERPWPDSVGAVVRPLLSRGVDGREPWLDLDAPVEASHILVAATRTRRAPAQVAVQLRDLGLRVPDRSWPDVIDTDNLLLLSRKVDGHEPWLDLDTPVEAGHLLAVSRRTGLSPGAVAASLVELGLRLPDDLAVATAQDDDATIRETVAGHG